jgi:hypothetical protein
LDTTANKNKNDLKCRKQFIKKFCLWRNAPLDYDEIQKHAFRIRIVVKHYRLSIKCVIKSLRLIVYLHVFFIDSELENNMFL